MYTCACACARTRARVFSASGRVAALPFLLRRQGWSLFLLCCLVPEDRGAGVRHLSSQGSSGRVTSSTLLYQRLFCPTRPECRPTRRPPASGPPPPCPGPRAVGAFARMADAVPGKPAIPAPGRVHRRPDPGVAEAFASTPRRRLAASPTGESQKFPHRRTPAGSCRKYLQACGSHLPPDERGWPESSPVPCHSL